jgi:hypothetical protein
MHIDDTQLPFIPAWEGALDTSGATFTTRGNGPQASIGQPTYWPLHAPEPPAAAGVTAVRPRRAGATAWPASPSPCAPATGSGCGGPISACACKRPAPAPPPSPTTPIRRQRPPSRKGKSAPAWGRTSNSPGPKRRWAASQDSIKLRRAAAAITLSGVGESAVQWTFQPRGGGPLLAGSLVVYVVVAVPAGETAVRAAAQLSALLNTPFGSLFGRLPDAAAAQVSWLLS